VVKIQEAGEHRNPSQAPCSAIYVTSSEASLATAGFLGFTCFTYGVRQYRFGENMQAMVNYFCGLVVFIEFDSNKPARCGADIKGQAVFHGLASSRELGYDKTVSSVPMVGTVGNKSWASALRHRYKRASSEALFHCHTELREAGIFVQNMAEIFA